MNVEKFKNQKFTTGFTLIELLIVVGILAALSAVIVIVLNPAELFKQARDSKRLAEIATLKKALNVASLELPSSAQGSPNTIYISVPDDNDTTDPFDDCSGISEMPPPPSGWKYHCVSSANLAHTDGSGWLPVNFASLSSGSPVSALPIDPVNTVSSGMYYAYVTGGSYTLSASLESQKRLQDTARNDGGSDPSRIEVGTDIKLWDTASWLVGYWKFDEGTGVSAANSSVKTSGGTGNIGSLAWTTEGKIGGGLVFDPDTLSQVTASNYYEINATTSITVMAWVKPDVSGYGTGTNPGIVSKKLSLIGWGALGVDSTGKPWGRIYQDNDSTPIIYVDMIGSTSIPPGEWSHIAMVADKANSLVKLYLNGAVVSTGAHNGILRSTNGNFFIGKQGSDRFKGTIDEVKVYNRALSDLEIQAYYGATR